jgi:hypothetical protein
MTPPTSTPPPPGWRGHAAAAFVTFHLACVILYALPRPPALDDEVLENKEVAAELDHSFSALHRVVPWRATPRQMRDDVLGFVRGYVAVTDRIRGIILPYLDTVGSTQSWHMFGGTPPRFPLVFVVEVEPEGEGRFVPFQDLNWGTADSRALNFRHRKVQELLVRDDSGMADYAAYWARRWDERHPDRPARRVRLSFLRLTTPGPAEVRRGQTGRHPEPEPKPFVWERRP